MNENYLDDLYNELKKTPNVSFDLDVDTFKEKMVSDDNYRNKVYSVVQSRSNNPKFKGVDPKSFYTSVLESSKKKSQSEIGSQATQPTDGSESVQFSPQGLRPEDQQVQEEQQVSEQPKRVIYRGEGTREALETQFAPQVKQEVKKATVTEATQPISLESKYKNVEKLETVNDKIIENFQSENRTKNFTPKDIEDNYNEYAKNALDDYLDYLNFVDRGGSQYQKTKEKLEYYRSLGDKLFNDENYADEYKNYVDLQKEAILNVNKQDAKYVNRLKDKYDWSAFNKKTSEVELKLSDIENQIKNISSDGGPLTPIQQKKYDDLLIQYSQIQSDYSNFSNELGITEDVLNQMGNSASRLSASQQAFNSIENEDSANSKRLKEYKNQLLSNKKSQEEFYGDKDQSWYEQFGKGVLVAGQQLGSSLIKGSISMVGDVPQLLTDAVGIKGYGVTDRIADAADNINSYVDLVSPQLEDKDFPGFVKASSIIGNGLGSVGTFMLAGGGATKAAQGILKTSSKKGLQVANKVGVFTAASSLSSGQLYDQLIEEGFNPTEASRYALAGGVVMGAAEMLVPEDELLSNSVRRTFIGALKNKNTVKEATEEALKFLYNRTSDITKTSLKEGGEEAVGQLAQDLSLQAASSISGKEIDGLWEVQPYVDNFLAGGGVGGVIELLKFGTRNSKYSNKFKESMLLELADNYDDISNKMAQVKPGEFDKIGEKYAKLKNVNNALKDIPRFEDLSHADKSHILALAYNKQVILDGLKQSGLDKSNFENELNDIETEIQNTLNKPKQDAVQEKKTLSLLKISNDGKLQSNQDFVSKRAQIERGIEDEKKTNYSDQETERRLESTSSWLQAISRGDREKAENKANELLGEYLQKQERGSDLSENNDRGGAEISSQGDNGEISKSETGEMGTRSPQEPEYDGQSNRKSSAIDESGTFQTSYDSETKGNEGKDVGISEIKRESVVQKTREMFELPFSKKSSRIARDLQKMLYEATSNKEKNEIINQIKQTFYESISKPSAEEVLPRQQGETTETGGQPQGMGPSVQGQEVTQEGKQEEVSVNREPISEDVAPEQKAKIEERNAQDEDEAVTEIYDFNDEIKSVGTKEQFKAFLRSLSPKGVFSRIAWHNSDKESLQPREGQYYTNTRRNAEETYKREFTHPAIIFGNAPQKMDFDQVQEFDINEVKSQGNDIVITDDLSPAIGAEMNYREFIPSSADQIIPIGTKENIEAFKSFVEQQKAATTDQVTEQATPQAQEVEQEVAPEEEAKVVEEASKNEGIKPKNMQDLIGIYRKVFGLSFPKAVSAAMVSNRLVKQMAKRAGVTPEQMYQRLSFQKANEKDLPQGVKMQVDAWHGSPYEFDKFLTEKMGTGEGAQAFGWGLYFTDLKNIAQAYAKALSETKFKGVKLDDNPIFEKLLSNLDAGDESFYNYDKGTITNLSNFKKYIDDRYDYLNNLSKNIDENHPLVKRFLSDNEYSQEKLNAAKENLKSIEDKNINIYKMLIDNGVPEKEAKALADSFYESKKKSREFIYEAMKYQASRENLVKKSINFVKNDLKSDLNYFKYLKDNFDKFELSRYLYKVSLQKGKDTNQYTWLEWDKPISNTPISKIDKTILGQKIIESNDSLEGLSPNEQYIQMEVDGVVNALNGERAYKSLSRLLGGDQQASLFLLENGIDGVKYPAESISRGATSETARGFNYVVFDENAVSIEEVIKFQKDAEKARGAMMIGMDGQAIIYALTDPNISTPLHELAHVFEHYLTDAEKNQIIKAAKTKGWTTETSEYFARGFEKYLAEGKSNNPIFEKFKQFLLDVYKAIKGSPIDVKLNKQMKAIYAEMLGEDITQGEVQEEVEAETDTELESIINEFKAAQQMEGIDKLDKMNELKEKYGEIYEKMTFIDSNFDELVEKFNAIRICNFEP